METPAGLHERGAKGTEALPTNAFGAPINAKLPAPDAATSPGYLRVLVLLPLARVQAPAAAQAPSS